MRDLHRLQGKPIVVSDIEEAHAMVIERYPTAKKQGSVGSWSWYVGVDIVAEAWIRQRADGWWLRLKRNNSHAQDPLPNNSAH